MAKDRKKKENPAETNETAEKIITEAQVQDETEPTSAAEEAELGGEPATEEGDGSVTLSKEEFEQAKAEIERMKKEIETLKENVDSSILDAQRIQAEFSNFRKRNASIRSESIDDGVRETIKTLLPVLDNFERAFQNSDGSAFAQGIEQIYKQLLTCLGKCGMEDAVLLQKYLLTIETALPDWNSGDMDENGKLNAADLTRMKQMLMK